jgi:hypothetical protein
MKQALRRKLRNLWLGELVAVLILIFAYVYLRATQGGQVFGDYALLALIILCVILLQGSTYWWLKLRQLDKAPAAFNPRLVQFMSLFDLLLLVAYPATILVAMLNDTIDSVLPDPVIGGGIFLFALAVFVHYFLVKLVRSDADRRALSRRRQVSARMMRELQRSEARQEDA